MPWTFSHPAIVFPIKQSKIGKFLNLPALIIGSISPDLFYSIGLYNLSTKAHHFSGWFYTACPICIIVFILLSILSQPTEKILPIPIIFNQKYNLLNLLIILFSLFIGAATHIIWDGFTHETGYFVKNISILQYNLINSPIHQQGIYVYKILQYLGSLLGVIYLLLKYKQFQHCLSHSEQKINQHKVYNLCIIAFISGIIVAPYAAYLSYKNAHFNLNKFVFNQLRLSELIFFLFILVITLWIKYRSKD